LVHRPQTSKVYIIKSYFPKKIKEQFSGTMEAKFHLQKKAMLDMVGGQAYAIVLRHSA
jgi:hypothetical protein